MIVLMICLLLCFGVSWLIFKAAYDDSDDMGFCILMSIAVSIALLIIMVAICTTEDVELLDYTATASLYSHVDEYPVMVQLEVSGKVFDINQRIRKHRRLLDSSWLGMFQSERVAEYKLIGVED